jgi:Tat protein secretion system quality control protein TatD with DNase activity
VTKLLLETDSPGYLKRNMTMRKVNQNAVGSDVYALIQRARMSELDRQVAVDAMRIAEAFADAVFWVKEKVAAIGTCFLKPSVKH